MTVTRGEGRARPRLLVLNQYYWPGVEATAQLLSQLCEALTADFEVTVVTGTLHDHEDLPHEEVRGGVTSSASRSAPGSSGTPSCSEPRRVLFQPRRRSPRRS